MIDDYYWMLNQFQEWCKKCNDNYQAAATLVQAEVMLLIWEEYKQWNENKPVKRTGIK